RTLRGGWCRGNTSSSAGLAGSSRGKLVLGWLRPARDKIRHCCCLLRPRIMSDDALAQGDSSSAQFSARQPRQRDEFVAQILAKVVRVAIERLRAEHSVHARHARGKYRPPAQRIFEDLGRKIIFVALHRG